MDRDEDGGKGRREEREDGGRGKEREREKRDGGRKGSEWATERGMEMWRGENVRSEPSGRWCDYR